MLVPQNVGAGAEIASVVGFHAVGRVERRGRGLGSLSRFRDGVAHGCGGLVVTGMRRAGNGPYMVASVLVPRMRAGRRAEDMFAVASAAARTRGPRIQQATELLVGTGPTGPARGGVAQLQLPDRTVISARSWPLQSASVEVRNRRLAKEGAVFRDVRRPSSLTALRSARLAVRCCRARPASRRVRWMRDARTRDGAVAIA